MKRIKIGAFLEKAKKINEDFKKVNFICVRCKQKQCVNDFLNAGISKEVTEGQIGFSCIGRSVEGIGCDWSLGGLFSIHTLEIESDDGKIHPSFELESLEVEK